MPDNPDSPDKATKQTISNFFNDESTHNDSDINIPLKKQDETLNYTEIVAGIYKEILNREPDLSGLKHYSNKLKFNLMTEEDLKNVLRESDEYKQKFVTNSSFHQSTQTSTQSSTNSDQNLNLVYCMIGTNRLDEIKPYIESTLPYIDKFIFIDGGSTDGILEYLKSLNTSENDKVEVYVHEWKDRFSEQRNNYLSKLRERDYKGWVLTSDTDEHFPEETLKQLRTIIKESNNGEPYTGVKLRAYDIIVDDDDRDIIKSENLSQYWKPLMFKFSPEIHYEGEPHETLVGGNLKWIDTDLIYKHIRSSLHILSRAAENYFISNSNRYSDRWAEFRYLCTINNIKEFKDYWSLFEKHELPKEVEDWLTKHKDDYLIYVDDKDEGESELRETYILYNEVLPKRKLQKNTEHLKFAISIDSSKEEKEQKIKETKNEIAKEIKPESLEKIIYGQTNVITPPITHDITSGTTPDISLPNIKYQVVTISEGQKQEQNKNSLIDNISEILNEKLEVLESIPLLSNQIVKRCHEKNIDIQEVLKYIELTHKLT